MELLGIVHFQLQFLILGAFCSFALIVYLGELLASPDHFYIKKYKLCFCGLSGCLYVTCINLGVLTATLIRSDLEINWAMAEIRKETAYVILGYGAVTSYLFIIGCLIKYLGFIQY